MQKATLEYMKANPDKVEKVKTMNHAERKAALEENEDAKAMATKFREKFGFAGEPEGSMRAAAKPFMMDPDVAALMKEIFTLTGPPPEDAPEEVKMYHKM